MTVQGTERAVSSEYESIPLQMDAGAEWPIAACTKSLGSAGKELGRKPTYPKFQSSAPLSGSSLLLLPRVRIK